MFIWKTKISYITITGSVGTWQKSQAKNQNINSYLDCVNIVYPSLVHEFRLHNFEKCILLLHIVCCLCTCVYPHTCFYWHDKMAIKSEEMYEYIMAELHLSNCGFSKHSLDPLTLESPVVVVMDIGGGHPEDVNASWPASWTQATRGSVSPSLTLECAFCPDFPQRELFSRMQSWESKVSGYQVNI